VLRLLLDAGVVQGPRHGAAKALGGASQVLGGLSDVARGVVAVLVVERAQPAAQEAELVGDIAPVGSIGPRRVGVTYHALVLLHLLDATYELFRAYFGYPERTAPDGREVGATLGVIETTLSLLRQQEVTHVAAATDTVIESFRNDLFDGYKTGEGVEPRLMAQFPLVERTLRTLGVVVWPMREFEADDAIATAALRWVDEVDKVVMLSPDKDLAQCVVGEHIVSYNRREKKEIDEDGVWEKFGVPPVSIPDYLALVGDTADGVPGIPGWGAKSSSTLLARYERLERIPPDPADWDVKVRGAARLAENLVSNGDAVMLYRTLTTLRRDVPLTESLSDLEWKGVRRGEFEALCDELGFNDVRSRPHRWQD
jgi:5'-3' exonuclease